jgi:hypothetical protein
MDLPNVTAMPVRLIVTFGMQKLYPLSDGNWAMCHRNDVRIDDRPERDRQAE